MHNRIQRKDVCLCPQKGKAMTSLANQMFFYNPSLQSEPTIRNRQGTQTLGHRHAPYFLQYGLDHAVHVLTERGAGISAW